MLLAAVAVASCAQEEPPRPVPIAAEAVALDPRTVEIRFTKPVNAASAGGLSIFTPFTVPEEALSIAETIVSGSLITLRTAEQRGGVTYAIRLAGLQFEGIEVADAPGQVNFEGFGLAPVVLRLDTRGFVPPGPLQALVTFEPSTGQPTPDFRALPLVEANGVHSATVSARIAKDQPYAARAVTADGSEASLLVTFTVGSTAGARVELPPALPRLPEFDPPVDPRPQDGKAVVRIVVDDRFARELAAPELRLSIDASGAFDLSLPTRVPLARVPGKPRVYEAVVEVEVDPARVLSGTSNDTFPYICFLVEGGQDVSERSASFVAPDESPQVVLLPIGNPALVPVTFRIDAGAAILEPDAVLRGVYPGEGLFLTGEFPNAEDGLGRLAADAFSGGERATLEMKERPDAPGIFEKTVFLPPNRPYGWKVVRCPTGEGCAELNRHVSSSGQAFPTVMKNLVTSNDDAGSNPSTRLIDPAALDRVRLENGELADYSRARVSQDGSEAPSTMVMFKQEAPDLVVDVGTDPVTTPIWIVGTWRDVNIPDRPSDIIQNGGTLDLNPFDYDDGRAGRTALIREIELPVDPGPPRRRPGEPAFSAADGDRDPAARAYAGGAGLGLWVGWNEREIYVATDLAVPGRDHFVIIALDPPSATPPAPWAKAGRAAAGNRTVFLAMEGDGDFAGWFRRGAAGNDDQQITAGARTGRGGVLEGALDLSSMGALGGSIWIAAVAYATADGGALDAARQNPSGDGDGDLSMTELIEVPLIDVRP
jgi:hypothetical protein